MTFNENCKFLDITKMETDAIKQKTSKGKEKIYGFSPVETLGMQGK